MFMIFSGVMKHWIKKVFVKFEVCNIKSKKLLAENWRKFNLHKLYYNGALGGSDKLHRTFNDNLRETHKNNVRNN